MCKTFRSKKDMNIQELKNFFEWQKMIHKDNKDYLEELEREESLEIAKRNMDMFLEAQLLPF